jgi:hypothetical protein
MVIDQYSSWATDKNVRAESNRSGRACVSMFEI